MKKRFIVLIVIGGVITLSMLATVVISLPWSIMYIAGIFDQDTPEPTITYGEFPFEITYMLNGETITVRDVYVCKYDGQYWTENGRYRKWKGYIKSTGEEGLFITEDNTRRIFCSVGSAEYYMNDERYPIQRPFTPVLWWEEREGTGAHLLRDKDMAYYGINLISWNFSDPIENSFE